MKFIKDRRNRSGKPHIWNEETKLPYCAANGFRWEFYELKRDEQICGNCTRMASNWDYMSDECKAQTIARGQISMFYKSQEWAELRYKALMKYERRCVVCGRTRNLTADHIKPIAKHPELILDIENLQIMCILCNKGKASWDETDWRGQRLSGDL